MFAKSAGGSPRKDQKKNYGYLFPSHSSSGFTSFSKLSDDVERGEAVAWALKLGRCGVLARRREGLDIFDRHGVASLQNRSRLRAKYKILRRARAGPHSM